MNTVELAIALGHSCFTRDIFFMLSEMRSECQNNKVFYQTPNGFEQRSFADILVLTPFCIQIKSDTAHLTTNEIGGFSAIEPKDFNPSEVHLYPFEIEFAETQKDTLIGIDKDGFFYNFRIVDYFSLSQSEILRLLCENPKFLQFNGRYFELMPRLKWKYRIKYQIHCVKKSIERFHTKLYGFERRLREKWLERTLKQWKKDKKCKDVYDVSPV